LKGDGLVRHFCERYFSMQSLLRLSLVIAVCGAIILAAALLFDPGVTTQLIGLLLLWAGMVKVAVVLLWTRLAGLGTNRHTPIQPN